MYSQISRAFTLLLFQYIREKKNQKRTCIPVTAN